MPEQPPKSTCEICGGFHPTTKHKVQEKIAETQKSKISPERLEFSPEMIEKIMEKVQDIEEDGTAYHVMTEAQELRSGDQDVRSWQDRLEDIFRNGLLGTARPERIGIANKITPQQWVEHVRKNKRGEVMFNIVGRAFSQDRLAQEDWEGALEAGKKWIEWDIYMWQPGNKVAIIFDLSKFREVEARHSEHLGLPQTRTFHVDSPVTKTDDKGRPMAERSYGFSLFPRVPQREFRGVVFKAVHNYTKEENENYLKTWGNNERERIAAENFLVENSDPISLNQRADEIVALMKKIYKDRPHLMVPVYDVRGNLYWPKKMSHAEIKELAKRRSSATAEAHKEIGKREKYSRTVLEIGCGVSSATWLENPNLEEYHDAHIIRTDIKKEALKKAKDYTERQLEKIGGKFTGKVEYVTANALCLPFGNNQLDEVYIANVLGEPDVSMSGTGQKIISEAVRVLRSGGELIIAEWATPEYAVGIGEVRIYDQIHWKMILDSFSDKLKNLGLEIKTIESPEYRPDLDTLGITKVEKLKEIFKAREKYLVNFPYGRKFISNLIIPRASDQHPFVIVLQKKHPSPPEKISPSQQRRSKRKRA